MSNNPGANDTWTNFGDKISPFAQRLTKGFNQARQWSEEKLGTALDVTELPQDYLELERKVDTIRNLHLNLLKVVKNYTAPYGDLGLPESLQGISKTLAGTIQSASQAIGGANPPPSASTDAEHNQPKTYYHGFSKAAFEGAGALGTEDSFGTVLMKFGSVEDKIGDNRVRMNQDVNKRVITPLNSTLNTTIQQAMKARRNVINLRLELDSLRSRYKNAKPERAAQSKQEVDDAEEALVLAVDHASELMRTVIENPEPLRNLADMVAAQMDFYKEAYELLSDIAPEIDEIQVTHESLYRQSQAN